MKARPGFAILAALVAVLLLLPAAASAACPNEEIRAAQKSSALPAGTVGLPDCMALEQVSGNRKENQYAKLPEVSADAQRIRYYSAGAIEEPPNLLSGFWNRYLATRGGSGWTSMAAAPPDANLVRGAEGANGTVFSPDFSRWFHVAASTPQFQLNSGTVYRSGVGGDLTPLSPLVTAVNKPAEPDSEVTGESFNLFGGPESVNLQGASADHSHLFFTHAVKRVAYRPGDPEPKGSADANTYVALLDSAGNPDLELLARDGNGKAWGGNCGAVIGGMVGFSDRNQGAIAANGSLVYLTTRPGQPPTGNCSEVNKRRIMRRVETPAGPWITHLVPNDGAGECDRVAPACATTDGDDLYQGASVDQTKVYFTTNRQLADTDLDGEGFLSGCAGFFIGGCDLYLYDASEPVGERLIQVSAGETNASHEAGKEAKVLTSIPAISGDGSHAYFVAEGVLTDEPNPEGAVAQTGQKNLYLYQRDEDHPDGRLAFIGAVNSDAAGSFWGASSTFRGKAYPVPATGEDAQGNEIGGDGHVLLFETKASLTPDDTDGGFSDIYRYDSQAQTLERVTEAAPGGEDNGPFSLGSRVAIIGVAPVTNTNGTDFAEMGRWASEDGETLVFTTAEGLLPEDTNGVFDSYLIRDGELHLLPGTSDPFSGPAALSDRPVLSHDGSVVAFTSSEQLLPSDGDSAIDVYSLRADGGYLIESEPRICSGEECQGGLGALPAGVNASSASTPSNGNVTSKAKRKSCPKGKRKARRAGKVRCVAKKAHKAKRKKAKKRRARAGRKQGGQK